MWTTHVSASSRGARIPADTDTAAAAVAATVAGPEADLSVLLGTSVTVIAAAQTLTFEHSYTWWGHSRKLRVTANPNVTITPAHVPLRCRAARVVLLGPLTLHDVDAAAFAAAADGVCVRIDSLVDEYACRCTCMARCCACLCMTVCMTLSLFFYADDAHADAGAARCCCNLCFTTLWCLSGLWARLLAPGQAIGLMGQGFQRRLAADGQVQPLPAPSAQLMVRASGHTLC
jgi:hypothetical protein